jgi:hypothetical protein
MPELQKMENVAKRVQALFFHKICRFRKGLRFAAA